MGIGSIDSGLPLAAPRRDASLLPSRNGEDLAVPVGRSRQGAARRRDPDPHRAAIAVESERQVVLQQPATVVGVSREGDRLHIAVGQHEAIGFARNQAARTQLHGAPGAGNRQVAPAVLVEAKQRPAIADDGAVGASRSRERSEDECSGQASCDAGHGKEVLCGQADPVMSLRKLPQRNAGAALFQSGITPSSSHISNWKATQIIIPCKRKKMYLNIWKWQKLGDTGEESSANICDAHKSSSRFSGCRAFE